MVHNKAAKNNNKFGDEKEQVCCQHYQFCYCCCHLRDVITLNYQPAQATTIKHFSFLRRKKKQKQKYIICDQEICMLSRVCVYILQGKGRRRTTEVVPRAPQEDSSACCYLTWLNESVAFSICFCKTKKKCVNTHHRSFWWKKRGASIDRFVDRIGNTTQC